MPEKSLIIITIVVTVGGPGQEKESEKDGRGNIKEVLLQRGEVWQELRLGGILAAAC